MSSIPLWRRQRQSFIDFRASVSAALCAEQSSESGSNSTLLLTAMTDYAATLYDACHAGRQSQQAVPFGQISSKAGTALKEIGEVVQARCGLGCDDALVEYCRLILWLDACMLELRQDMSSVDPGLASSKYFLHQPFLRPTLFPSTEITPHRIRDEAFITIQLVSGALADASTKTLSALSDSQTLLSVVGMLSSEGGAPADLAYFEPHVDTAGREAFRLTTTTARDGKGATFAGMNARKHLTVATPQRKRTISMLSIGLTNTSTSQTTSVNAANVPIVAAAKQAYKAFVSAQETLTEAGALHKAVELLWGKEWKEEKSDEQKLSSLSFEFDRQSLAAEVGSAVAKYFFLFYHTAVGKSEAQHSGKTVSSTHPIVSALREEMLAKYALSTSKTILQKIMLEYRDVGKSAPSGVAIHWKESDHLGLISAPLLLMACGLVHTAMYHYHKDPPIPSSLLPHVLPPLMIADTILGIIAGEEHYGGEQGDLSPHQQAVLGKYFSSTFYSMLKADVKRILANMEDENAKIFHNTVPPKIMGSQDEIIRAATTLGKGAAKHSQLLQQANVCIRELTAGNIVPIAFLSVNVATSIPNTPRDTNAGGFLSSSHGTVGQQSASVVGAAVAKLVKIIRESATANSFRESTELAQGITRSSVPKAHAVAALDLFMNGSLENIARLVVNNLKRRESANASIVASMPLVGSRIDNTPSATPHAPFQLQGVANPLPRTSQKAQHFVSQPLPTRPVVSASTATAAAVTPRPAVGLSTRLQGKLDKVAAKHDRDEEAETTANIQDHDDGPIDTKRARKEIPPPPPKPSNVKLSSKFDAKLKKK